MSILILGMGPAALFAAKACENFGVEWKCLGRELPSLRGPIFFREPLTAEDTIRPIRMELVGTASEYSSNKGSPGKRSSAMYFGLQDGNELTLPGYSPGRATRAFRFARAHRGKFQQMELSPLEIRRLEGQHAGNLISTLPGLGVRTSTSWMFLIRIRESFTTEWIRYVGTVSSPIARWGCMWGDLFLELSPRIGAIQAHQVWQDFLESGQLEEEGIQLDGEPELVPIREVVTDPLSPAEVSNECMLRVGRFATGRNRELAHDAYRQTWDWLVKYHA